MRFELEGTCAALYGLYDERPWRSHMRQRSNALIIQMQAFGSVERDPELHITQDGTSFTEFTLVVNTKRCVEDITILLFCYAWGSQAENIQRSVTKGSMLFVQGHFTPHQYLTEDGKQEVSLEVNVEKFSFADGSKPQENDQQSGTRLCTISFHG
jgi:single-stranded DNA-binding protein